MTLFDDEYVRDAFGHEQMMIGIAKGESKGRLQERTGNILALKKANLSDEFIASSLGIPLEEVRAVQPQS